MRILFVPLRIVRWVFHDSWCVDGMLLALSSHVGMRISLALEKLRFRDDAGRFGFSFHHHRTGCFGQPGVLSD